MNKYLVVKISDILLFPSINSGITKKFCKKNKGEIPVYGSAKNKKDVLGFIKDNIKKVHYYENCLSYNRNGSVGYTYFHNYKFSVNEDCRVLILKEKYNNELDYNYLKYIIQNKLLKKFNYSNKAGKSKVSNIKIKIPIDKKNNKFDIDKQKEIAKKFLILEKIKKDIKNYQKFFERLKIVYSNTKNLKSFFIGGEEGIFNLEKGKAKYTKKYMNKYKGKYPVYSSQTSNNGIIANINKYDYDTECLTWTTDGTYVGTVFHRNNKFSMTTHCGALIPKKEFKNKIYLPYLFYILNKILPKHKVGEGSNKRLGVNLISKISFELPVDKEENIDLEKQKELYLKFKTIDEIKDNIKNKLKELSNYNIVF